MYQRVAKNFRAFLRVSWRFWMFLRSLKGVSKVFPHVGHKEGYHGFLGRYKGSHGASEGILVALQEGSGAFS